MLAAKHNKIGILSEFVQIVIGFRSSDIDDAVAIKHLKQLESICISFNILPNGFSQDPSVTPSRWTAMKFKLYTSVMIVNIIHLLLLSCFTLPDEWLFLLGDFFYGHPNGRFFWLFCLSLTSFSEVLRHFWIFLIKNGSLETFKLENSIYLKGFKSEVLFMDQIHCRKFRFVATNLAIFWFRIVFCVIISFGPILIFIVHSVSQLPKTPVQFIFTGFWLIISYLGISCTMGNCMLTGGLATVQLSYFYYKASHVARKVQDLALKRKTKNKIDYFEKYKATVHEIIKYQNETEKCNIGVRNWFIFLYLGISFAADFGAYTAVFVHIDHGFMDFFIAGVSMIGFTSIGACSYVNGVILTKMSSCCLNLRKANRYLQLNVESFMKGTDLQDRLTRTDIAFTIGEVLDMTTRVFVIYLIENICLVMMFKVNFK